MLAPDAGAMVVLVAGKEQWLSLLVECCKPNRDEGGEGGIAIATLLVANEHEAGASPSLRHVVQRVRRTLPHEVVVRLDMPQCGASGKWQQGRSLHGTDM